jgi:hypothetical protein
MPSKSRGAAPFLQENPKLLHKAGTDIMREGRVMRQINMPAVREALLTHRMTIQEDDLRLSDDKKVNKKKPAKERKESIWLP